MGACESVREGVRLTLRAQPRAKRSALVGLVALASGPGASHALKIAVSAPPVEGAANEAIVRLLAEVLGLPKRAVVIAGGEHGREKRVIVTGLSLGAIVERLAAALPADGGVTG